MSLKVWDSKLKCQKYEIPAHFPDLIFQFLTFLKTVLVPKRLYVIIKPFLSARSARHYCQSYYYESNLTGIGLHHQPDVYYKGSYHSASCPVTT